MKKLLLTLACALPCLTMSASQRDTLSLNRGWMFRLGDAPETITVTQATASNGWKEINVPHDFQIEQPWVAPGSNEKADNTDIGANIKSRLSGRGFKEMGCGWYVRTITPTQEMKGKRLLLNFDGIIYVGDVYLNGKRIGGTDYGYVGFEIDITDAVKYGEANTIAVKADTGEPLMSRWYTGGGLFRNVYLVTTGNDAYFARHPLYITTKDNNKVNIKAEARINGKSNDAKFRVTITDPQGKDVVNETFAVKRNRNFRYQEYELPTIDIANPQLWDCDTPNLYLAKVELLNDNGEVADCVTKNFGIRTVEIVPNKGFLLNGKKVLLEGYANHHDLGALGAAAYPRAIEKRLQLIKSYGMNHIRSSHNPYSTEFLDLCDKYGILVVDELYDKWNDQYVGAGRNHFENIWMGDVTEWVKRDRNHPCVVMWSLGNELQGYNNQPFNDWGVTQFKLMKTVINRYDDTRKVTVAMHPRYRNWETNDEPCDLAKVTDVQSYNYRYMYFPGDGAKYPWMTFYQSEASVSAMGENYFAMDRDKVIGLAYWGAIDYLGESHGWPDKGWNEGVIDISLEPKPKAFYMKSFYSDEPCVHIGVTESKKQEMWNGVMTANDGQTDHWNRTPGQKLELVTYTNADEVELVVNGKSYGTKQNDKASAKMRNQIRWKDIEYQNGYIEAIARTGGKVVARHKVETTGKAVALKIINEDPGWKADGLDLQHLRVIAVDKKGRRVPNVGGEVKFSVTGDATLVAVSSGNQKSDELNVTDHRMLFNGSVLGILRAGTTPSNVTVTATCEGMKAAKLTIPCGNVPKKK